MDHRNENSNDPFHSIRMSNILGGEFCNMSSPWYRLAKGKELGARIGKADPTYLMKAN